MTGIVCGVVERLQRRETGHPDEQGPEQDRGDPITHRFARASGMATDRIRVDISFSFVLHPRTETEAKRRRQVS